MDALQSIDLDRNDAGSAHRRDALGPVPPANLDAVRQLPNSGVVESQDDWKASLNRTQPYDNWVRVC